MKIKKVILNSIVNGLFFSLPFLYDFLSFLLFLAFTFLFYNQKRIPKKSYKTAYLFICVFIWQFILLYWFHSSNQASFWSVNLVILLSIIILFLILLVFFLVIIPLKLKWEYSIFCLLWIGYELFWIEWEIPYPLFSLGVVLGNFPDIIQWYSITGILGGSLWILFVKFLILRFLNKESTLALSIAISLPIFISLIIFLEKQNESSSINAIAVNNKLEEENGIEELLMQLSKEIDGNTDIIVSPEGLLSLPLSSIPINRYFSQIKRMLISQSPDAIIVWGSKLYESVPLSRYNTVVYNIAVQCDTSGFVTYRNKKTLVPFGEAIPYEKYLGKINAVKNAVNEPITYNATYDRLFEYRDLYILPLICYELYFNNEIRNYFKESSIGIICCISNEYSVPNKTYYTQFLRMSRVQAITFNTPIIKSTVNGYSSIIDAKGNIISTEYNTNEVVKGQITLNSKKTIFTKHGCLSVFILLIAFFPLLLIKNDEKINNNTG